MLSLSIGFFVVSALNSLEVQAQIPTNSMDYWIGNISPRCAVNIFYFNLTNDFIFNSVHNIPVTLSSLNFYHEYEEIKNYLRNHQFKNISLRFIKAECYFTILYCKKLNDHSEDSYLNNSYVHTFIENIAYGFPDEELSDSNSTYCLILYHGSDSNDEALKFDYRIGLYTMEMN